MRRDFATSNLSVDIDRFASITRDPRPVTPEVSRSASYERAYTVAQETNDPNTNVFKANAERLAKK